MQTLETIAIPPNSGRAFEVPAGQRFRVFGTTIADLVAFDRHNLRNRFDQGRTKTYNSTIYVTRGHTIMTKSNEPLMRVTEDTYVEGTHDMQKGMCSGARFRRAANEGRVSEYYNRPILAADLPDHGCYENLSRALEPYGVPPEDIPSPYNLFQTLSIEFPSGHLSNTLIRPRPGTYVEFEPVIDVLVAISACPDLTVGGKEIRVEILGT